MTTPAPSVVYVLPATSLHGGNRVIFEHADGLLARGYDVTVVGPDPPPDWHRFAVPYRQLPVFEPGAVPRADIAIGTFYNTVGPAFDSGAPHVFHFAQGYEGQHREYAPIQDRIDAAYQLPIPKLLISSHLVPMLEERYACQTFLLGQAIDSEHFSPGDPLPAPPPLEVGVVGPYGIRPKGIGEALSGLGLAREAGFELVVHHASADPITEDEKTLGVTDHFHHRVPTERMPDFYRGLHALIHPSHDEEGFPLPPLEAMACGVPVALTTIRPFAVLPDEAVIRFPPGQPEALIEVIRQLYDRRTRESLAAAGLTSARTYRLDRVLDTLEAAFRSVGAPTVS